MQEAVISTNSALKTAVKIIFSIFISSLLVFIYLIYFYIKTQVQSDVIIKGPSIRLTIDAITYIAKIDMWFIFTGAFIGAFMAYGLFRYLKKHGYKYDNPAINAVFGGLIGFAGSITGALIYLIYGTINLGFLAFFGVLFWCLLIVIAGALSGFTYGLLRLH